MTENQTPPASYEGSTVYKMERNEWTEDALRDIIDERERQDEKWGADRNLEPGIWLGVLGEEYGEACQAALHAIFGGPKAAGLREELVQVAAVALAWIESIDRVGGIVHPRDYWTKPTEDLIAEHRGDQSFAEVLQGTARAADECANCGHPAETHANGCRVFWPESFNGVRGMSYCKCHEYTPKAAEDVAYG